VAKTRSLAAMIAVGMSSLVTRAPTGVTTFGGAPRDLSGVGFGITGPHEANTGWWQRNLKPGCETVLAFAAVYACVTRIANDIAKLRIKLVEKTEQGIWVEVVDRNSPFAPVLRKPNRYQTRIQFLTEWLLMKLLYGNTYVLKQRDKRGIVVAMYVLDSRRVRPMVTPDGGVYYQLSSDYLAGLTIGGLVRADDIIHDRGATLFHPLVGVSPLYACAHSAAQGMRIQANSSRFFENMSRPSGVLTAPGTIEEATAERLKQEWNENFSRENIGRLAILGDGLKYEAMTIPAEQAQLIEQLGWTVADVARAFGMPLYKIGAGPVPTSNNVEALQQQYYTDCLQVFIESLELCLDEGLGLTTSSTLSLETGTELDLDGLLRMDSDTQIKMLSESVKGALMKPNEARLKLNLPPVDGGDAVYLQQQNYSLPALAKRDRSDDPFGTAKPPAAPAPSPLPSPAPAPKAIESAELTAKQIADEVFRMLRAAEPPVPAPAPAADRDDTLEQVAKAMMVRFAMEPACA
jgi:HK97 family phage portal protein